MPLTPGVRLGVYEVLGLIGAGGMGEVYRARDTKLGRDVALKILPELFAADPDRLARFQREAQVLASLNHPNIAAIYGLEEADPSTGSGQAAVRALVLELVEGPTLADRIARGPIPLDDALPIARQIADALEAAHEQGIIHRDLKPANIKLKVRGAPPPPTEDGRLGEVAHVWPQMLPGSKAVLFTIWTGTPSWDEARLAIANLETGQHTVVLRGGTSGHYAASGHLVFWRGNALMAAPFDLDALEVTGEPVRVVPDVRLEIGSGRAHFALSQTGTLAFVKGGVDTFAESFIAERSGRQVVRLDETVSVGDPEFSPDGKRVALTLYRGGAFGIGVHDLERRLLTPLTLAGDNLQPTWTRKGDRVTFLSNAGGEYNYYSIPFDGSGKPEPLFSADQGFAVPPSAWSPDDRNLVYVKSDQKTGMDIWIHTPGQEAAPRALIATTANETNPAFSPDGRFIAYQSDESGVVEIYVRPFPKIEARRELVSRSGGMVPRWSRDGAEILYVSEKGVTKVSVAYGRGEAASLSLGQPSLALEMTGLLRHIPRRPDVCD